MLVAALVALFFTLAGCPLGAAALLGSTRAAAVAGEMPLLVAIETLDVLPR